MKDISACLSSNSDDWKTPSKLYKAFMALDDVVDVCPFKSDVDLYGKVYKNKIIFMNPPFSELSRWCDYALMLARGGNEVYLLMPVRTDTKYFKKIYCSHHLDHIYFFSHRLKFSDALSAPFPSMLLCLSYYHYDYDGEINVSLCSVDEFIKWRL